MFGFFIVLLVLFPCILLPIMLDYLSERRKNEYTVTEGGLTITYEGRKDKHGTLSNSTVLNPAYRNTPRLE